MKVSFENLIQKFKAVGFDKDELELSELKQLLPLLAYQDSNSDAEIKF